MLVATTPPATGTPNGRLRRLVRLNAGKGAYGGHQIRVAFTGHESGGCQGGGQPTLIKIELLLGSRGDNGM